MKRQNQAGMIMQVLMLVMTLARWFFVGMAAMLVRKWIRIVQKRLMTAAADWLFSGRVWQRPLCPWLLETNPRSRSEIQEKPCRKYCNCPDFLQQVSCLSGTSLFQHFRIKM
jgi:hypothetical protein